jgi:hypothetical protein
VHRHLIRAFDDYIATGLIAVSSTELMEVMGRCDQLALHAIVDDVSTAGKFDLFVESSADGRTWVQRNRQATTFGHGDISFASISAGGGPYEGMWSDGALQIPNTGSPGIEIGPLMPYVRFRIQLAGGAAHVVVDATMRDVGRG